MNETDKLEMRPTIAWSDDPYGINDRTAHNMEIMCKAIFERTDRIESKLDQLLAQKKKRTPKKVEYPDWFEEIWAIYPKRQGSNPKRKAMSACMARQAGKSASYGGMVAVRMRLGAEAYARYCDATGKTGTEYVMQAATFFGPDEHYLNDWTVNDVSSLLPRKDDDLVSFSVKNGLSAPRAGENWKSYRGRLERELQLRNKK